MPKLDGSPTAGEVTAEQLRQTKAELHRLAQALTQREQAITEKSAAASLAEQIQALRQDERERNRREGQNVPAHRPSEYSDQTASALCQWIAEGGSLKGWSRETGIAPMTVYRWMADRSDFRDRYARAHEDRADSLADEILDIADETAGTESIAAVQAARLRVEARKWIASKLRPSKWGEKQQIEQTGTVTFNLGIPSRPVEKVIDGKSLIVEPFFPGLTDSQSVNQLGPPSLAARAGRANPDQRPGSPPEGEGVAP